MTVYDRIHESMRRDEAAVLKFVRAIRRDKHACYNGECWPPTYLSKAIDRLEQAGMLIEEPHLRLNGTRAPRSHGMHFRAKRGATVVS